MNPLKIAYIGGGSGYAAGLVRSFVEEARRWPGLFGEVALMDIDADHLATMQRLGQRIAAAAGVDLKITATTNRREALGGADFVLTSFRAGGFEARAADERIPLRYGVLGQETVGPGGFFFALRSLKVTQELCAEIEEICPDAWLINYTNPTNIIGEAVSRFTKVKVLALCDGGKHDAFHVARLLGYRPEQVEFRGLGFNHATWSTLFTIDGQDGVALMDEATERVLADPVIEPKVKRMFRLARHYRRLPNDYLQYYYFPRETFAEAHARAEDKTRAESIMASLPEIFAHYDEAAQMADPKLEKMRGGGGFGDFAVEIISAVARDTGIVEMLNVPNLSVLPGIPAVRVAEVPCLIGKHGGTPLAGGELPDELWGLLSALGSYQALAAEAGWHGDRELAIKALAANPLVWALDLEQVAALYDEMAAAHARWLPARLVERNA